MALAPVDIPIIVAKMTISTPIVAPPMPATIPKVLTPSPKPKTISLM
ncbi:hypothetical protein BH23THE1_BH23THE1_15800 [soil metagenome]